MSHPSIMELVHQRLGERTGDALIPAPVFETMEGEFLEVDLEAGVLKSKFPILHKFLNPYASMQGGIVTAAVDNTIGPLSVLVAPPNVTRRLGMKFSRPVTIDMEHIIVQAQLVDRSGRRLTFRAEVRDKRGILLARAKALHWITEDVPNS